MALVSAIVDVVSAIGTAIKGKQDKSISKVLSSDFSITSTTFVDVPTLDISLGANRVYQVVGYIPFIRGVTGAVCNIGYSSPIDALTLLEVLTPIKDTNLSVYDYYSYLYSNNTPISDAKAGYSLLTNGDNNPCMLKGIIKTNSAGTFTLRVASEDGSNIIIKQNTTLIIIPA